MTERGGTPVGIAEAIEKFLANSGLGPRLAQAEAVTLWPEMVGAQIAAVTQARGVGPDGTLLVAVRTSAWMNELSLREPDILRAMRANAEGLRIRRIRWVLWSD